MPTVDVNIFDYASASRAARSINEYYADLVEKANEVCEYLSDYAGVYASPAFKHAAYDGVNDVKVHREKLENGYAVIASGEAAAFIEYGSGVYHNGSGSYPGEIPPGIVGIGQYGKGLGSNPYWFYTGQPGNAGGELAHGRTNSTITHGNPPAAIMYRAEQIAIHAAQRAADEVFR